MRLIAGLLLALLVVPVAANPPANGPLPIPTWTNPRPVYSSIADNTFVAALGGTFAVNGKYFTINNRRWKAFVEMGGTFTAVTVSSVTAGTISITVGAGVLSIGTFNVWLTCSGRGRESTGFTVEGTL